MIAVQPMSHSLPRVPAHTTTAVERESQRRETSPGEKPSRIVARFQPLDPGIVNDTIPAFFIGRNKEGFWVARDVKGKIGGIFLLENSAMSFARKNSRPSGCATISSSEGFELDLENSGNPLVEPLGRLMRLARRQRQKITVLVGRTTEAVKRRLKGADAL
jgi:hypothetical protein